MISGGGPSFLFSIGLWRTYRHPEIILFSPTPQGFAPNLAEVVRRIAAGEVFEPGTVYNGLFAKRGGAFRPVHRQWYVTQLGTAAAFYESFEFPALQLFWPDRQEAFPWNSGFDAEMIAAQAILAESNLVLANVGPAAVAAAEATGSARLAASLAELFVEWKPARQEIFLESWHWLIGTRMRLFRITLFGDLFLTAENGNIHWLDTGSAQFVELGTEKDWREAMCMGPGVFFHLSTLLQMRALGFLPPAGHVYSWIHPPMMGGAETTANFDVISAEVHVSNLGRTALALQ
jgi:hypothetical protein